MNIIISSEKKPVMLQRISDHECQWENPPRAYGIYKYDKDTING